MKKYYWSIEPNNSEILLKAKYLQFGTVTMRCPAFKGHVIADKLFSNPEVLITIDATKITTQNSDLDERIKSPLYFDAHNSSLFTFHSQNGCKLSPGGVKEVIGNFNIKTIDHQITLIVTFAQIDTEKGGGTALFQLYGNIHLKDWEVGLNDDGVIDDAVLIMIAVSLHRKKINYSLN